MRTQARGLAAAVADVVVEMTVPEGGGLAFLPIARLPAGFHAPWPDLLVSCGRRAVSLARALKKASGGSVMTVHIQDPRVPPAAFDLVVAMNHDRIAAGFGPHGNVIKVATALHDLTSARLAGAAGAWRARLERLGRPLVGVAVGGSMRGHTFKAREVRRLIAGLKRLRTELNAGLAITPSRRTSPQIRAQLAAAFAGDPRVFLWDMQGDNPYLGILALADRLVVTSDSVSMVSEALASGHPVEILDLGFARHVGFVRGLVESGQARRFEGDPAPFRRAGSANATVRVAEAVKLLLQTQKAKAREAAAPP